MDMFSILFWHSRVDKQHKGDEMIVNLSVSLTIFCKQDTFYRNDSSKTLNEAWMRVVKYLVSEGPSHTLKGTIQL